MPGPRKASAGISKKKRPAAAKALAEAPPTPEVEMALSPDVMEEQEHDEMEPEEGGDAASFLAEALGTFRGAAPQRGASSATPAGTRLSAPRTRVCSCGHVRVVPTATRSAGYRLAVGSTGSRVGVARRTHLDFCAPCHVLVAYDSFGGQTDR